MKVSRRLIEEAHNELDCANALFGTKEEICIYCSAKEYNGIAGIIHTEKCIITRIRKRLGFPITAKPIDKV